MSSTFSIQHGRLYWQTQDGPAPLHASQIETLLSLFEDLGLKSSHADLYEMAGLCPGFIPRVSCFRKAS